ncbi:uncharacterized protein LOC119073262 isoform X2 [Bradysia coprophila]|uniref:uncharacterized protein LOC119073262 isoform X2 n=1 Tax=Bradysia coprophila TaxID=38358 RepID=UPI00187DBD6B|nr:uncharacterized protein LOC119073262 isoform X2 [Bradysia coprophila]
MNESAAHSTSCGSVPNNHNLNQMSAFFDLTGDGNEFSLFHVIDLTHVPKASAQCSVDSSRKLPTQNRTDLIDLTEDSLDNDKYECVSNTSISRINEALDIIDKKQLDKQSAFSPTLAVVDLTEETFPHLITNFCSSEFSTIPGNCYNFGDTNTLTHLNDETLQNEQSSSLPVIANSTQSLSCPVITTVPSKESAFTMDLPAPAIFDITEESLANPICSSEFSTIQVPGDHSNFGDTNALTHLNDGTLRNEQNSVASLPVIDNLTQSLLCPVTTAGPSKESTSTMDLPTTAILDLTEESLPKHLNDGTLRNEQNSVASLPVIDNLTQSLLCPLTITGPANESACAIDSQSMPAIVDLTGEILPYPMTNICPSEFSTMQVTKDRTTCDTNERTHLNDETLWDEQNSVTSLPVVGDSSQSLLCPLISARPSNEAAAAMDWENTDDFEKLSEHFESLQKKISDLESTVVDLNDDNDTSFLVIEEYKAQACQIYERIRKKSGKPTKRAKDRIKFDGTPFPAFNAKLEQYVNKKRRLPVFKKVLKRFKTYNRGNNWQLNEEDCYQLVEDSLLKIGKKLQSQRYVALNDIFAYYTNNQVDPAELDPELKAKLDRKHGTMV